MKTFKDFLEDIKIPINVGDTVLGGKWKNKRIVVKSITKNDKGDYQINGKPMLKFRIIDQDTVKENLEEADQYKSVKMLDGLHLTAVDKKGLLALINARNRFTKPDKTIVGSIKRKGFTLTPTEDSAIFKAKINTKEKNDRGEPTVRTFLYTVEFKK